MPGGGGGGYILVGVWPGTPKKGGLRFGHSPKRGVLDADTAPKMGVLGASTTRKGGVLDTSSTQKRGNLGLILRVLGTEVAQKGVLGAYLFIIFTFTCQYYQLVGVCSGRLNKGGLRCGHS